MNEADTPTPLARLRDVRRHFHLGETVVEALAGVSLDIHAGEGVVEEQELRAQCEGAGEGGTLGPGASESSRGHLAHPFQTGHFEQRHHLR